MALFWPHKDAQRCQPPGVSEAARTFCQTCHQVDGWDEFGLNVGLVHSIAVRSLMAPRCKAWDRQLMSEAGT
jgi:hypothetical protein